MANETELKVSKTIVMCVSTSLRACDGANLAAVKAAAKNRITTSMRRLSLHTGIHHLPGHYRCGGASTAREKFTPYGRIVEKVASKPALMTVRLAKPKERCDE
jgi:hypothetical protein